MVSSTSHNRVFGAILILMMLIAGAVEATESDEAAQTFYRDGIRLFDDGQFVPAAEKFRQAYNEKKSWKLFYNLGQAEAAGQRYGLALDAFEQYMLEGGDNVPDSKKDDVLTEITRLRVLVGIVDVVAPAGAELFVDDTVRGTVPFQGVIRVAAGKHYIQIRLADEVIYDEELHIAGGLTTTVEALPVSKSDSETVSADEFSPNGETEPAPSAAEIYESSDSDAGSAIATNGKAQKMKVAGIIAGSVGVVGIGIGTAFFIKGSKDSKAAEQLDDTDPERMNYNNNTLPLNRAFTITGFAVGATGVTAGVVLFVLGKKLENRKTAFVPTPGGVAFYF